MSDSLKSQEEMRANLPACHVLVVESLPVTSADIAAGTELQIVQKFGTRVRNIDVTACARKGVKLLTLRRRADVACAEHIFGLILTLSPQAPFANRRCECRAFAGRGYSISAVRP